MCKENSRLLIFWKRTDKHPQDVCRRRPLELHIRPHNVCRRPPQDAARGRPLALYIGQYGDVFRTLQWSVLKTSYFKVLSTSVEGILWTFVEEFTFRYIEDQMGTFIGHILGKSSGYRRDVIFPSGNILC